jgi:hypothetical protein
MEHANDRFELTFAEVDVSVIRAALSGLGGVVARARAPDKWQPTVFLLQHLCNLLVRVRRLVGRLDICGLEPFEGRHFLVVLDCCLEEIDNFFMLLVGRAVAGGVEGRETGGVFGEFVAPEPWIRLVDWGRWGGKEGVTRRCLGFGQSSMCSCTPRDRLFRMARGMFQCWAQCTVIRVFQQAFQLSCSATEWDRIGA